MSQPTRRSRPNSRSSCAASNSASSSPRLPERLALARTHDLGHVEFLEQLFSDEVPRRDAASAGVRARAAKLDPLMVLEAWDESAKITYDRAIWSELVSHALRRTGPQRLHHGAGRRRQDLHGHRARAHRLSATHQRALRTRRPVAQEAEGGPPRRQLRPRDAQAHRRRPARDRRLRPPAARHARDGRHLRALRGATPRQGHGVDLEP